VRNKVVNRKRVVLLIVALVLASAALAGWLYVSHPPGADYTQFTKIKRGMTLAEVDHLLGGQSMRITTENSPQRAFVWGTCIPPGQEPGAQVEVTFDSGDRAVLKRYYPPINSFLGRVEDKLYHVGLGKLADLVF
jgi:hypothetical protein